MTPASAADDSSSICPDLFARVLTSRIGSDSVLDKAVTYAIDGFAAFVTEDPLALDIARRSNTRALKALREALSSYEFAPSDGIVLSLALLVNAEVCRPEDLQMGVRNCDC